MPTRSSSRTKTTAAKQSAGKRKVHRSIPRTPEEFDENLPVIAEQVPRDTILLTGSRSVDFWSFPLNNLIRVDWSRRVEMFPNAPGKSSLQSVVYGDLTYDVESLDPRTMGNADIELLPECRYYIVPIREEDQSQVAPRRLLLVRRRRNGEKLGPHIWIIGLDDTDQTVETYASLHIIGGDGDVIADEMPLQPAGIVEAVLTITRTASPPQPPQMQSAVRSAELPLFSNIEEYDTLKFIPAYSNFAGVSEEVNAPNVYGVFESELRYEEYVEVGEFSISGKSYTLRPIDAKSTASRTFKLKQGYQYFAIQAQGDSMEPTIFDGEYVLVRSQKQPDRDNQIIAVNIGHQTVSTPTTALIKRLSRIHDGIRLESDNPNYSPQIYTKDDAPVIVLGVVEAILSPISPKFPEVAQKAIQVSPVIKQRDKDSISTITLIPPATQRFTPEYMTAVIGPYVNAIVDIQHLLDEIRGREPYEVIIRSIRLGSVEVSLEGAAEAVEVVQNTVVPWRREHVKTEAILSEQNQIADIEKKKADTLEARARADRTRLEASALSSDDPRQREEIERLRLENDRRRFELERDRILFLFDILENKLAISLKDLSHEARFDYAKRMLIKLNYLESSDIQLLIP